MSEITTIFASFLDSVSDEIFHETGIKVWEKHEKNDAENEEKNDDFV
jgi:hypothetical protein